MGLRLLAVVVHRWEAHSGWNLAKLQPRPTRKLAPAGTTLWFRILAADARTTPIWRRTKLFRTVPGCPCNRSGDAVRPQIITDSVSNRAPPWQRVPISRQHSTSQPRCGGVPATGNAGSRTRLNRRHSHFSKRGQRPAYRIGPRQHQPAVVTPLPTAHRPGRRIPGATVLGAIHDYPSTPVGWNAAWTRHAPVGRGQAAPTSTASLDCRPDSGADSSPRQGLDPVASLLPRCRQHAALHGAASRPLFGLEPAPNPVAARILARSGHLSLALAANSTLAGKKTAVTAPNRASM